MLLRGFAALSLALTGGSAFTKNCRPSSLTTLAICAFAPRAKKDAQKIAQDTSVPRRSRAVIVVRLFIMPLRLGIQDIRVLATPPPFLPSASLRSMRLPYYAHWTARLTAWR